MGCPECDDLHAFLRVLRDALHNRKVRRDELIAAISVALDHEHGIGVQAITQTLRNFTQGRGGTRPPARRGAAS